jgi:uncharacterized protein
MATSATQPDENGWTREASSVGAGSDETRLSPRVPVCQADIAGAVFSRVSPRRILRATVLIFALAVSAFALDPASLKPEGYVSDFAHVVDAPSRQAAEQYCYKLEQATGVQVAVVTIDSLEGAPIEDFANDLLRKWGVGHKGQNDGLLLLLAIKDRKDRVEVGYGLEPILPDGFVGDVAVDMRPLLQQGQYGAAILQGVESMGSRVAAAKHVTLDFEVQRPRPPAVSHGRGIPLPLIIVGVVILLSLLARRGGGGSGGIGWFLLGTLMGGGGRGGWGGGGGFGGGGGGGGGFGGFGGGDSGGGGASSGW